MLDGGVCGTYHVLPRVHLRQHLPCLGGTNFEIWNDSQCFDLRRPVESSIVSDIQWRNRRDQPRVNTTSRLRQDFAERHFFPCHVDWIQVIQICSDEPAVESCRDVIRMALDHKSEVEDPWLREAEATHYIGQENASDDCGSGRAKASSERDWIVDLDVRLWWEGMFFVAAEDVEGGPGEEVVLWVKVDVGGADAVVGDGAIEWDGWVGRTGGHGDFELEVHRQCEADDIEARACEEVGVRWC